MISTTWWPRSWNSRSLRRTTVWPRWMSGVVGSTPNFTRSGLPRPSWRSNSPSGSASTALRVRKRAASAGESVMRPMLDCPPRWAPGWMPCVRAPDAADMWPPERGQPLTPGRSESMQEPPTPITDSPRARGPRFVRLQETPPPPRPPKPKVKKLRLAFVLLGLTALAIVSTFFGMLMAVARDLPSLENQAEFEAAENSVLYADGPNCKELDPGKCTRIAKLTGNLNRILVSEGEISPNIKNAVIAVEDRRFYSHEGVDYAGIGRALWQDILRRSA